MRLRISPSFAAFSDVALITLALACALSSPASAVSGSYEDNFITDNGIDPIYTTAFWDASSASIHLPDLPLAEVASWPTIATVFDVAGDRAILGQGSTVSIQDISDPLNPVTLGTISLTVLTDTATAGCFDGRYLALGVSHVVSFFPLSHSYRVEFWDLSNPASPVFVSSQGVPDYVNDLVAQGGVIWCALDNAGVAGIDLADPAVPSLGTIYATSGAVRQVEVQGSLLILGMWDLQGVQTRNIVGRTGLNVGPWSTSGLSVSSMDLRGSRLYVAASGGVRVYDMYGIVHAQSTWVGGPISPTNYAQSVVGDGPWVMVGESDGSIELFEKVGNSYLLRASLPATGSAVRSMALHGQYIYAGTQGSGNLRLIRSAYDMNQGTPEPSDWIAYLASPPLTYDADIDQLGDLVFVAHMSTSQGLRIIDASDPAQLVTLGSVATSGTAFRVSARAKDVWIIDGSWIRGYDLSNPSVPSAVGAFFISAPDEPRDLQVDGNLLYLLRKQGLSIYDISNPNAPSLLGSVSASAPRDLGRLVVHGRMAYASDISGAGFRIFDVGDSSAPQLVRTVAGMAGEKQIAVSGNRLVTASLGLFVYSLDDPTNLTLIGSQSITEWTTGARGLVVEGDRAYVTDLDGIVSAIDLSQSVPARIGIYDPVGSTAADSWGLTLMGDHLLRWGERKPGSMLNVGIESIRVRSRVIDTASNFVISNPILTQRPDLAAIRLVAPTTGNCTFRVHFGNYPFSPDSLAVANNGQWIFVPPNMVPSGSQVPIRWAAELQPDAQGTAPSITSITLEWLGAKPDWVGWTDITPDEGGEVQIEWARSGRESIDTGIWGPVTDYVVYRNPNPSILFPKFVPTGWDSVGTVAAVGSSTYSMTVPVLADSVMNGGGTPRTVFLVQARRAGQSSGFDSEWLYTFGIDNLDPNPPLILTVDYSPWDAPNVLTWWASGSPDVARYRIYRGSLPDLSDATVVDSTTALTWTDPTQVQPGVYYGVQTVDDANRGSIVRSPNVVTAVDAPAVTRLWPAAPNPFNPATTVVFDVAEPTADFRLDIFDVRGRHLRTLVKGAVEAGRHLERWDGRDDQGGLVSSGVYFVQMRAAGLRWSQKLVLAK